MAGWASPIFDWSSRSYGKDDFNVDNALRAAMDRSATMNDPENFRKRKVAMMNAVDIPLIEAQGKMREGVQRVANEPEIAKLDWDKSPTNQQQWLARINAQNAPAQTQANTQEQWRQYQSGQTYFDREKELKETSPPDWQVAQNENGGIDWYNSRGRQEPGFMPGYSYTPRKFVGPPAPPYERSPEGIVSDARSALQETSQYAQPKWYDWSRPARDYRMKTLQKSFPGLNFSGEALDKEIDAYYKRRDIKPRYMW